MIDDYPHKVTGIKGWTGAQYRLTNFKNGKKQSLTYHTPEEISGLVGKLTDPKEVSDFLQGKELVGALMVKV